jgi:hypothetical protein
MKNYMNDFFEKLYEDYDETIECSVIIYAARARGLHFLFQSLTKNQSVLRFRRHQQRQPGQRPGPLDTAVPLLTLTEVKLL